MSVSAPDDAFLDVNDAHLRVYGNVHADGLKLGQLEVVTTTSTGSTINFLHQHTAFTTTSNILVGTTNSDLFVDTLNSRVGVLTNTPATTLDVNGTVTATSFSDGTSTLTGGTWSGSAASLTTAVNIGGVAFDGSASISLPGVDLVGSQSTTGSAAKLTTPVNIGGVAFDGSASIVPTTFGAATFSGDVTVDTNTFHVDTTNNRLGIGTTTPKTTFHNTGDFFIAANSDSWTSTMGKGLYIRYSTNSGQDATYIQSITRSASPTAYHPMHIYGSTFSFNQGNVGIGTQEPHAPLTVFGIGGSMYGGTARSYFWAGLAYTNTGTGWSANESDDDLGIYSYRTIATSSSFLASNGTFGASDERIKKEIVDINDASALETLRLLKPKQYKYVDEIKSGSEPVWGFIAQEVRETLPYATQLRRECIPNIYELANVSDSRVITFINFDTSDLESNAMVLKVFDKDNTEHLVNITEVVDEHTIRVDEDLSEWTGSVDESGNVVAGNQLFVYGQRVDDFVYLKKESIWTVATAALQEVDRQLQTEKARNDALEARIAALENNISS
jgi:hypothetical protein